MNGSAEGRQAKRRPQKSRRWCFQAGNGNGVKEELDLQLFYISLIGGQLPYGHI